VGIQGLGAKMSGSKGNAVSPLELLDIYEPELLKWLYFRKSPDQSFELAFNTEIYRQYDEFDTERGATDAIPFRQAVSFGQIVGWQADKLGAILEALSLSYSTESIERRLPLARNWLVKYNPDEVIALRTQADTQYANSLGSEQKARIERLRSALETAGDTVGELETLVYDIPKEAGIEEAELKRVQRAFFKDVYMLLIGRDTGPRLGTFLWASDRKQILKLLSV
jgi:lysyl-tRNA synthetase class 1